MSLIYIYPSDQAVRVRTAKPPGFPAAGMTDNKIDIRLSSLEALGLGPSRRIEIDADICDAAVLRTSRILGLKRSMPHGRDGSWSTVTSTPLRRATKANASSKLAADKFPWSDVNGVPSSSASFYLNQADSLRVASDTVSGEPIQESCTAFAEFRFNFNRMHVLSA
jgi:hypothetical protein